MKQLTPLLLPKGEVPDAKARCCADCKHLAAAVSWWCTSEEAIKRRGTSIPGIKNCPQWEPAPNATT